MRRDHASDALPAVEVVQPPGDFGDGPAYVRVDRLKAGHRWSQAGHQIEVDDGRCVADKRHDYVVAENTHNAFIYAVFIRDRGVPAAALTVVRIPRPPQMR